MTLQLKYLFGSNKGITAETESTWNPFFLRAVKEDLFAVEHTNFGDIDSCNDFVWRRDDVLFCDFSPLFLLIRLRCDLDFVDTSIVRLDCAAKCSSNINNPFINNSLLLVFGDKNRIDGLDVEVWNIQNVQTDSGVLQLVIKDISVRSA